MLRALIAHPAHPPRTITSITVAAERDGDWLRLRYALAGAVAGLRIAAGTGRCDGLWQQTCCEAFVAGDGPAYREFNFAPGGGWAAYGFEAYRTGIRDIPGDPATDWRNGVLSAAVRVDLPGDWRVGLSAVVEEADGTRSFWALTHPAGAPDFHDRDCFALTLPRV